MSLLTYHMDIRFTPERVAAGQQVSVEVRLADASNEISSVHLTVPEGAIYETLQPLGAGVYTLTRHVPYEAPPGRYVVYFYARDVQGNRGPEYSAELIVA